MGDKGIDEEDFEPLLKEKVDDACRVVAR
ncbi:hypothetical protein KL86SPO_70544 [uncultured Sporomusa sp.]|uniref:Uncharacterized protein n=1 Tax=uncultured Sporomusa sp. TaxID=307249 RepID=A0A212M1P7_9FIRM|nr:hypothetical protein KL86SPO_70544 [uncultured Sporomusa sp.]